MKKFLWLFLGIACASKQTPQQVLHAYWPREAVMLMRKLVTSTPTHHSHYFSYQELSGASHLKERIIQDLQTSKSHSMSYFLVSPFEISLFLNYLDCIVRLGQADMIDYAPSYFVIKPRVPFKPGRTVGLSFRLNPLTQELDACEAPYIKFCFDREGTMRSLYPIPASATVFLRPQDVEKIFQELSVPPSFNGRASIKVNGLRGQRQP